MAKTRTLQVIISGDPKQLRRAFGDIDRSAAGTETRLKRMGKVGALAFGGLAAAAGGAAVIGLKKSADAAIEAEKAQARMTAQLKASGISYRAHAKEIDAVIQRTSRLAGIDDEDLQDAFTNIVRSTGSVDKGLRNIGLAADIARAKHIDVAKAGQLLGRVATGNVTALARYGIQIDKNATSSEALAELQKRFSGQAEAYGKTTAGSMERSSVAVENLGEAIGAKLSPFVAKGADALTELVDKSGQAAGPIRRVTGTIANAYNTVRNAVTRFARTNREDIASVVSAVRNLGRFFRNVFEDVILPTVRAALPGIRQALNGIITIVRGIIRVVSGIINGDWKRVWDGLKDIVKGAINGVVGVVRAAVSGIGTALVAAGKGLGKAIVRGIVAAFSGIGNAIKNKISDAVGSLNPFGEGLGKRIGDGAGSGLPAIPNLTGVGAGNLMGAKPIMAPFASLGARYGLHTSSGIRPGSTTLSGNVSYHSSGNAIDEAGPFPAMHNYAKALYTRYGPRLRELISPWANLGIKDGRPFRYSPAIQAQHSGANAHVHVAYTGDGVGDGLGPNGTTIARFLLGRGFSTPQVAGIMGNLRQESGFDPGAVENNGRGPGIGIAQWSFGRADALRAFAQKRGTPWSNLSTQLAFMMSEFQGSESRAYRGIRGAKTVEEAETAFGRLYERYGVMGNRSGRQYLAAVQALAGKGGGTTAARSGGGGGGGGGAADTTNPYELAIAGSDVEIAQAQEGGVRRGAGGRVVSSPALRETSAQRNRLSIVNRRIAKVQKALKRKLTPATRLRLRQELAGLMGERATIRGRLDELAQLPESTDSGAGTTVDGSTEADGGGQENQALVDAINANTAAQQEAAAAAREHASQLEGVKTELKRQTDFATSVQSTESFQLKKYLADLISGQVGGYGVAPRSYTPGTGVAHAY